MAETGNIEDLAKLISNDIFKWLKWEKRPIIDENWACVNEKHNKQTHPSDVVFSYTDPYTGKLVYVNTDLKSYSNQTITPVKIKKALNSLSMSVECANVSSEWQKMFLASDQSFEVVGMLFIYNHDNEYDERKFTDFLSTIKPDTVKLNGNNKLFVLGPDKIKYLINVVNDIKQLKADELIPDYKSYSFYYPDLVLSKRHGKETGQPASLEVITSPYMIIKHGQTSESKEGLLIYYNRIGSTVEEFIYLLDTLSHYQLLLSKFNIKIRFVRACKDAILNLEMAKNIYLKTWGFDENRKTQIEQVSAGSIQNVIKQFNPFEIGMRDA